MPTPTHTLIRHFFRRFFDNDTLHVQGDTVTTVVRALSAVAVPGLMFAFFLQNAYPRRPLWSAIQDQYFFVLFSFIAMGAVTVVEWQMLFPDRLDFLVLSPLSLKPWQMLGAKASALAAFLALFLFAANIFGTLLLPAVSHGDFFRQLGAHAVAATLAGLFAALALLALGGLMLCLLDPRRFHLASPLLQMASVVALTLLFLHYVRYGNNLQTLLATPLGWARWIPPFWFLALYEHLLRGPAAPAFAAELAPCAYRSTALAALLVLITYPLAWARMRRVAIEGTAGARTGQWPWVSKAVATLVPHPGERAVVHFIGQTMLRTTRYQVYLALYGGVGFGLAIACATNLTTTAGITRPQLSSQGLNALMPLLVFWVVAGLRNAFAFPLNLQAGWIFRVTAVQVSECANAGRRWVFCCALAAATLAEILVAIATRDWPRLLVQAVCAICLATLLTDAMFPSQEAVPFNRPRMPGLTNFPLMLTLYVGIFPILVLSVMSLERQLLLHPTRLIILSCATAFTHIAMTRLRQQPTVLEEDLEGYDEAFQLLGLR